MKILFEQCFIAIILFMALPKAVLFIMSNLEPDIIKIEAQRTDFINWYVVDHKDCVGSYSDPYDAWDKSDQGIESKKELSRFCEPNFI